MARFVCCVFALTSVWSAGCATAPVVGPPAAYKISLTSYDEFINESLTTLRRYDYIPQTVDRATGRIVTEPSTGGQWFEFWRRDSRGAYQSLENSLHTMRRRVFVNVTPVSAAEADGSTADIEMAATSATVETSSSIAPDVLPAPQGVYRVEVRVEKERLHAPDRQAYSASSGLAVYSTQLPTVAGERGGATRQLAHWSPTGRDPLFEDWLLDRLAACDSVLSWQPAAGDR